MTVKKRAIFQILISLICLSSLLQAEVSPTQLRGMSTCMEQGYEHYSPAQGALYWSSALIRNTLEFRNNAAPLAQLARELFFLHHDKGTFDITRSATKIAFYYTPKDIGRIIGYLHQYKQNASEAINDLIERIKKEKTNEIKAAIIKTLNKAIGRQTKILLELIDTIIAQGMWDSKKQSISKAGKKLDIEWQRITENIGKARDQRNWKKILSIIQGHPLEGQLTRVFAIMSKNQMALEKESKESGLIAFEHFHKDAHDFTLIITQAYEHEPLITIGFLLAWLWKYANTKDAFIEYLKELDLTIAKLGEHIFNMQRIATQPFSYEDFKKLNTLLTNPITQLPPLEELIFYYYGYKLYMAQLPEPIFTSVGIKSICQEVFSDCGETALRNFFNALLYDPLTQTFDVELLKKLHAYQPVIDFYTTYPTTEHVYNPESRNDWARVVSGLPNVTYNIEDKCEISSKKSGCENTQKVIQNLLPGIDSLATLVRQLGQFGIIMKIEGTPSNNPCRLSLYITKPHQVEFKIEWEFFDDNFLVKYPEQKLPEETYITLALLDLIDKERSPYKRWENIVLLSLFTQDPKVLLSTASPSEYINILLLLPTQTPIKKIVWAKYITQLLKDNPNLESELKPILLNIYTTLAKDQDYLNSFAESIMTKDPALFGTQRALLKNIHDPLSIACFTQKILSSDILHQSSPEHAQQLFGWILDNIDNIEPRETATTLESILHIQFSEKILQQPYIQKLLQWGTRSLKDIEPVVAPAILDAIVDLTIPVNEDSLPFITKLHDWFIQILKPVHRPIRLKYIKNTIQYGLQDDSKLPRRKLLIDKIIKEFAPLSPYDRSSIARRIIEAEIPSSDLGKKTLQELYTWLFDNLNNLPKNQFGDIIRQLKQKQPQLKEIVPQDQWDKIKSL